jgi:DNA-binding XRE family transcriptional regulator
MTGTDLRSRRLRAGCSRYQLAHAVGVEPMTVAAWEDEAASITCPNAIEQVLRQFESRHQDGDRLEHRGAA